MRLVTLPAIRLSRFSERLRKMGIPYERRTEILQALEDEVEVGARRIGSLCPEQGCVHILTRSDRAMVGESAHCVEHGWKSGPFALVIAFEPCTS